MATQPSYAATPEPPDIVQVSTANANRDGTGTIATLTTGTTSGFVTEQIRVTATGTTTAGMIRFFLSIDGGTTWRLLVETPVTNITPSATTAAFSQTVDALTGLTLQGTTTKLGVATNNAETFNVFHHKAQL